MNSVNRLVEVVAVLVTKSLPGRRALARQQGISRPVSHCSRAMVIFEEGPLAHSGLKTRSMTQSRMILGWTPTTWRAMTST